jgi:hypothetical protein
MVGAELNSLSRWQCSRFAGYNSCLRHPALGIIGMKADKSRGNTPSVVLTAGGDSK